MALGTLSPDQQRFAEQVAAATGLDLTLVRAWVGAESGWGVTKGTHNYLNVGPGQNFADADTAAARVAQLLTTSSYYAGVRAAIPAGGAAQAQAIAASPWDAGHYGGDGRNLTTVYSQLAGQPAANVTPVLDLLGPFGGPHIPGTGSGSSNPVPDAISGFFGGITNAIVKEFGAVAIGLVFTVFALVLIGLGISRLTSISAGDAVGHANNVVGVANLAKVAAI